MSILDFVLSALSDKSNKQKKFFISLINRTEAENLALNIQIDLTDYNRILDNFGVKHTIKKHGNLKKKIRQPKPTDFDIS